MSMQELIGIASQSVADYREQADEWLKNHVVAAECRECEDCLDAGLEAYKLIGCVDTLLHKGAEQDIIDLTHELQEALLSLYDAWLVSSNKAEIWMASLSERGESPKNALEIRAAIAAAREIVDERKTRMKKIKSVNTEMLTQLAKTHSPPAAWFDGHDDD